MIRFSLSIFVCGILLSFPVAAETVILKDTFQDSEERMPDGSYKPYPNRRNWAFTFWPGVRWPDSYGDGTNWLENNDECQAYLTPYITKVKGKNIPLHLRYDPFTITDQGLHIKADLLTPEQQKAYQIGGYRRFGSGLLKSNQSFTYGSIHMIAKLPSTKGTWPAFWLLSAKNKWPPEIDIFEGMAWGPHQTELHSGMVVPKGEAGNFGEWFDINTNPSQAFHDYGLEWTKDTIKATFDGKVLWEKPTPESMHDDMYLLINLAVGGKWVFNELGIKQIDSRSVDRLTRGADMISGDFPAEMVIKSVTVTQQ